MSQRGQNLPPVIRWPKGQLDFSGGALMMGILNVTPDSFSDGGLYLDMQAAVDHAMKMAQDGAAIIDIGAESTRPGSKAVPADEQLRRVIGVIERLAGKITVPISIDTKDAAVAMEAITAGAAIINDITALADPAMRALAAQTEVPVVLMHMQGTPETMQQAPAYGDVVKEVGRNLTERAAAAERAGVLRERIIIDPGIGFGKTMSHNLQLLRELETICGLGYRVLVGTSRKGFIGQITGRKTAEQRDWGTAATVAMAIARGASIVRVHHTEAMADVVKTANAVLMGLASG